MVSATSYFARMNRGRKDDDWLTESQLLKGTEEFFKLNDYSNIEYDIKFDQGARTISSPIVGYRKSMDSNENEEEKDHIIVSALRPKIKQYDLAFFGYLELTLFDIMDNYEYTNLMLVTDSLSYLSITKSEEINVAIESMMEEGLYLLYMNQRFSYGLFDKFADMTSSIPIYE